jgi:hypothetical protein
MRTVYLFVRLSGGGIKKSGREKKGAHCSPRLSACDNNSSISSGNTAITKYNSHMHIQKYKLNEFVYLLSHLIP